MEDENKQGWLTPLEAARKLHVSKWTVWRMCQRRKLPDGYQAKKVGHQWRLREQTSEGERTERSS